jgi:hypothetical protein
VSATRIDPAINKLIGRIGAFRFSMDQAEEAQELDL